MSIAIENLQREITRETAKEPHQFNQESLCTRFLRKKYRCCLFYLLFLIFVSQFGLEITRFLAKTQDEPMWLLWKNMTGTMHGRKEEEEK